MTRVRSLCIVILIGVGTTALRGWFGTRGLDRATHAIKSEFDFGFEQGHIAGNLARGHGYSVKFGDSPATPTAWASPLYPLMLAGIFRVWGAYTFDAAVAVIWSNAIFHGVMAGLLYVLGRRIPLNKNTEETEGTEADRGQPDGIAARNVGLIAVALFLVMPSGWQFLHWAWCVHLLGALILLHLWVLTGAYRSGIVHAALAGATLALAMLADGAAVTLMPLTVGYVLWARRPAHAEQPLPYGRVSDSASAVARVFALSLAWLAVMSPWMVRNGLVLGNWSPLRGMLGTALWMGNHPGAADEHYLGLHENPWHNPQAARRFIALGERGFDADCRARFVAELRRDPVRFARNCAMRLTGFWFGQWWRGWQGYPWNYSAGLLASTLLMVGGVVGGWRRRYRIGPLIAVLLLFPLPYYLTFLSYGRYRFPVEAVMYLLVAMLLAALRLRRPPQRGAAA